MENNQNYLQDLYAKLQDAADKLVVSYLEEREKDPNGNRYPYKTNFTVNMLDTRDVERMFNSPDVLQGWLGFELGVIIEPDGKFFKSRRTQIDRFSCRNMELLVQLADENTPVDTHVILKGKYHTLLFQKEESNMTPLTCVTGDVKAVKSYIKNLVDKGKILAYEIWSGAGENKMVKSFKVEKNYEVSGIPRYDESTTYDIAFILDNAVLTLEQAQRLVYFNHTQSSTRNITWGTSYRVSLRVIGEEEKPKMGLLWTINNPLD